MLRQSGDILDIARAICSSSNGALGFVNQHRVLSLMQGSCRTANSCEAGLIVGALRIACNCLCTAARFHTAGENPGCLVGCHEELDCLRHYNRCPTLFDHICFPLARHQRVYFTNGYLQRFLSLSLVNGLRRAANSCKASVVVDASRIACNGLCTAARFHTAEENPGCLLGVSRRARLHSELQAMLHPIRILMFPLAWHRRLHVNHGHLQRFSVQNCRSKRQALHSFRWLM